MAPINCIFYVKPNTITDLTIWKNGVQVSPESSGIDGEYLWFEYLGGSGIAVLKATGYEDLEIDLYEGPSQYYTLEPTSPPTQYASNISDGTNTYVIKDAEARAALSSKQDVSNLVTSISASSTDAQYPSAKCMYDIVGDVVTLINAL